MDPAPLIVIAAVAIFSVAIFQVYSQGQKRQSTWKTLAEQLGLTHEGSVIRGEYAGLRVRIAMETHRNPDGYGQFCVVRAEVPAKLPEGFVAAPRRWTTGLDRMLADNTFTPTDPALKECYIFQSDRPQEGQALVEEPQAQQALLSLYNPKRVGFVEKNRAHVAYFGFSDDAQEIRGALEDVTKAARTLAAVRERLAPGA
ncbi:hypothetical protein [Hyalangium gracile]|uniref:hypothetical protein n=1 Tax=Hyalangium gracile TaxID=394092 RepID=UPI001CCCE811|nr:hypothetical protein [Hyalangium gracile]